MGRYLVCVVILLTSCATMQQREIAVATGIQGGYDVATTAVTYDIITPEQAELVEQVLLVAENELRRAVTARRTNQPREVWQAAIDVALDAINAASNIIKGKTGSESQAMQLRVTQIGLRAEREAKLYDRH